VQRGDVVEAVLIERYLQPSGGFPNQPVVTIGISDSSLAQARGLIGDGEDLGRSRANRLSGGGSGSSTIRLMRTVVPSSEIERDRTQPALVIGYGRLSEDAIERAVGSLARVISSPQRAHSSRRGRHNAIRHN
jgi:hypothetical protein